jgi:hypothetical protein
MKRINKKDKKFDDAISYIKFNLDCAKEKLISIEAEIRVLKESLDALEEIKCQK